MKTYQEIIENLREEIEKLEKEYNKLEQEYQTWKRLRQDSQALSKEEEIVREQGHLNHLLAKLQAQLKIAQEIRDAVLGEGEICLSRKMKKKRLIFEKKKDCNEYIVYNQKKDILGQIAYYKVRGHRNPRWWFFVDWHPMDSDRDFWISASCLRGNSRFYR